MEELDEVIGRLTAAALQLAPSDDQIIADHVRDSVAMLLKVRHKLRERAADLRNRLDSRLNDHLCEMKGGYDDSIVGFNKAWDVMRKCFDDTKVLI
jgi:hypothetical protein